MFSDQSGLFLDESGLFTRTLTTTSRVGPLGLAFVVGVVGGTLYYNAHASGIQDWLDKTRSDCKERKCMKATPENIRAMLALSPLLTNQPAVSASVVQLYVDSIELGNPFADIVVDGNVLIDGHHRYIAAMLCGIPANARPGTKPMSLIPFPLRQMRVDP